LELHDPVRESTDQPRREPSLRLRRADRDDRKFLRELAQKVFSVYGSYERYLTEWYDSDGTITLIGVMGDERVGLAMLAVYPKQGSRTEAVAELLAIAVEPKFQSKGIGTVLLEKVIEEASHLPNPVPIVEMHLSVAEGNSRAQRLFARRGFRLIAGEGVYPAGQRALHMVKVL
jgi:ribosomal protein S18 acetylase RimI-like enzyme